MATAEEYAAHRRQMDELARRNMAERQQREAKEAANLRQLQQRLLEVLGQ
jgi:hypothetical protein